MRAVKLLIISIGTFSCSSAPKMEREVTVWNGAPERAGICQGSTCIEATDPSFKSYGCLTFADIAVIQRYVEAIIHECERWK